MLQKWVCRNAGNGCFFIALRKDLAVPFLKQVDLFCIQPELKMEFSGVEIPFSEIRQDFGNEDANGLSEMIGHYWRLTSLVNQ